MSKVGESRFYWRWIKFDVDFNDYEDDVYILNKFNHFTLNRESKRYKLQQGFEYVGLPNKDDGISEWYNGGWSSEYNHALQCLIELGFIEIVKV